MADVKSNKSYTIVLNTSAAFELPGYKTALVLPRLLAIYYYCQPGFHSHQPPIKHFLIFHIYYFFYLHNLFVFFSKCLLLSSM